MTDVQISDYETSGFADVVDEDVVSEKEPVFDMSIVALIETVNLLKVEVMALKAEQSKISGMLETITEQVGPTIEGLQKSPLIKMIGGM